MPNELQHLDLWKRTLGQQPCDDFSRPRELLRESFDRFRQRVSALVATLGTELPGLTVHDITHLDALWRVANEIAGPDYPLNPAEAFVLGGAFLLHDAAHVRAAYPGGLPEIFETVEWKDLIAHRYGNETPEKGSKNEQSALFQVLRLLHSEQAARLSHASWKIPGSSEALHLIEPIEIRRYYGELIGEIASSHHWSAKKVTATFSDRHLPPPAFLSPATWAVDALKIALLLRTADAAHLDDGRAPWFLFALRQPEGISTDHWRFQAKMGQPTTTPEGQLRLSAGESFSKPERRAWWLAYEAAQLVDRELRDAKLILDEERRPAFRAVGVLGVESTHSFAQQVPVSGWEPIEVGPIIGDVPKLIDTLGGAALYGDEPAAALRELLQNALDAVRAMVTLGRMKPDQGCVEVTVGKRNGTWLLEVTDNGIGMSRHVLTRVLLDFGTSLWSSDQVRQELPGLTKAGFSATGKFGIGFYSVFMLGGEVGVLTRRFERSEDDPADQWQLQFEGGLAAKPILTRVGSTEGLTRQGTRVTVEMTPAKFAELLGLQERWNESRTLEARILEDGPAALASLVAYLCPASDAALYVSFNGAHSTCVVGAGDWLELPAEALCNRVQCKNTALYPLKDDRGTLIGRVGMAADDFGGSTATVVISGVRGGELLGVSGIVLAAANNSEARRTNATPSGSASSWQAWADAVHADLNRSCLLKLHPVTPAEDLPIWVSSDETLTLSALIESLRERTKIVTHSGDVGHDDSVDEVSTSRFDGFFKVDPSLVVVPRFGENDSLYFRRGSFVTVSSAHVFPWALGMRPIDYRNRFETALSEVWGDYEIEEDVEHAVGAVNGEEIYRYTTVYTRKPSKT